MNWTQIEGRWDQVKGSVKREWGKLTDDELDRAKGRRDILVGKIRERYGETKEAVEEKLDALIERL